MKDFAKSIVCNVKAEVEKVGNYNPSDYKDDPMHKWTVKSIENEIDKTRRRLDLNRRRIQDLRSMVNSRQFGPSTLKELKDEEKDYEVNQMRIKQLVSMLHRATGNELPDEMVNGPAAAEIRETAGRVYKKEMREDDLARATAFELAKKYKNFQKSSTFMETIKDVLKKFKTGNINVGNAYTYAGNIPIEKIPDNWRPEFPKAGYVVYYAPNKAKWFATESEAKKFAEEQDKKQKTGNSKVGNGITKFGLGSYVIADGHKAIVLGETVERGPNGIPFGWVTIRWVEGPWKGQSDQQYDYDLKKA